MRWTFSMLAVLLFSAPADAGVEADGEDVLVARYACLIGGREAGTAPTAAGVLSGEELSAFLLEWTPESDNQEVREVFALNDLGELARQASQLPLAGGAVSGIYNYGGARFDIAMNIRPAGAIEDAVTINTEIRREGELLSGPRIHTPLGERAIVTTTNGPEAPFLSWWWRSTGSPATISSGAVCVTPGARTTCWSTARR